MKIRPAAEWLAVVRESEAARGALVGPLLTEIDALTFERNELRTLLVEALEEWEYAVTYKGEYFDQKHGDSARIAEIRALIGEAAP
jgi:hypothetical protein